jgi:5-methyltetrahydrofolate--homocysteine methyltransferase
MFNAFPLKSNQIAEALRNRILVLDGAMGTALQNRELTAQDFGGESYLGCNEMLVLTRPDVIEDVHRSYLEAGADIVETNTFGATPLVLGEYDLSDKADAINRAAVAIAKRACAAYDTPDKPRFVAGSMGPTTKALSVTGGITFDELADQFEHQAYALTDAGSDYLLLETALDTLNLKAGLVGIDRAFSKLGYRIPVAISGTIETMGTMLAGQGVEALYTSVAHADLLYIGLNCATGPSLMKDHIRTLAAISAVPVACVPNAGIPDADGLYPESPDMVARTLGEFVDEGWLNLVGGCCGTTPPHIAKLADRVAGKAAPTRQPAPASRICGLDPLVVEDEGRPYIIGERTNVIGSRLFKEMIVAEKFEEAAEIARKQVKAGAHIIDVCLSNPDRNEVDDILRFMAIATKLVKAPFMIDSQVPEVIEAAFKLTQGKCILNSVNMEDGEESFEKLLPIVKCYGAAIVVGCIQSEMAVNRQDKLRIASESYTLLTQKYGIDPTDIYFDPLVFPCGTGDANYFGSGRETIEGVRLIKQAFPLARTTLGISNVSFGLPPAGREVLNSVFLYECVKAGLDTAIVNAEKLVRYASITDEEKELCMHLLDYDTDNGRDPVADFAKYFRDKKVQEKPKVDRSTLTVEEKLKINIVEGTKEYLIENLDEALKKYEPLGVINGPLMAGMDVVGKMFNDNQLIVAEVLQSAEAMKAAVSYLEQFMAKGDTNVRGTMLLATVKGDVHDIGKNLVQIILGNNGYKVVDLGIKCPPETLIAAYHEHHPDFIGLSGLLVKSAQQMVITATDLKSAGISVPILVGGAALTDTFTAGKIAPTYDGPVVYCKDAMTGLAVANKLTDKSRIEAFVADNRAHQEQVRLAKVEAGTAVARDYAKPLVLEYAYDVPQPPTFEPVVIEADLDKVWAYLNPQMLYGNHLGLKGNVKKMLAEGDEKALKLQDKLEQLKAKIRTEKLLRARGLYQFFKVRRDGDSIVVLDPKTETDIQRYDFPRQSSGLKLCLSDFIAPDRIDVMCFFVVTCGEGVTEVAKQWLDAGNYFDAHAIASLALESAEAFGEYLHHEIRGMWGFPDAPDLSLEDVFKLKYRGVRVSFGYPACPRLEDQAKMWELLRPDLKLGVALSEEYMMHPEASVSALVFHHPQARYFSVSPEDVAKFEKDLSR